MPVPPYATTVSWIDRGASNAVRRATLVPPSVLPYDDIAWPMLVLAWLSGLNRTRRVERVLSLGALPLDLPMGRAIESLASPALNESWEDENGISLNEQSSDSHWALADMWGADVLPANARPMLISPLATQVGAEALLDDDATRRGARHQVNRVPSLGEDHDLWLVTTRCDSNGAIVGDEFDDPRSVPLASLIECLLSSRKARETRSLAIMGGVPAIWPVPLDIMVNPRMDPANPTQCELASMALLHGRLTMAAMLCDDLGPGRHAFIHMAGHYPTGVRLHQVLAMHAAMWRRWHGADSRVPDPFAFFNRRPAVAMGVTSPEMLPQPAALADGQPAWFLSMNPQLGGSAMHMVTGSGLRMHVTDDDGACHIIWA